MELNIVRYDNNFESKWDTFIEKESLNGTFLHTRNFLNYHPEGRFEDCSLMVMNGTNIVAVIPACKIVEDGKSIFSSHSGSTFGGIVLCSNSYNISYLTEMIPLIEKYLLDKGFSEIIYKNASEIFCSKKMDLLDYFLFKNDYNQYNEVSFVIPTNELKEDITANFVYGKRRHYKYSLKQNLVFKELVDNNEVYEFHYVLCENLKKFNTKPVHTLEEIIEFKNKRLTENVKFYGVYKDNKLVAGSMVFLFGKKVFHTQYLAAHPDFLNLYPMEFMDTNMIRVAKEQGYEYFSFGISTEDHGKVLNEGLALFKEGFGTSYSINRTYYKKLALNLNL